MLCTNAIRYLTLVKCLCALIGVSYEQIKAIYRNRFANSQVFPVVKTFAWTARPQASRRWFQGACVSRSANSELRFCGCISTGKILSSNTQVLVLCNSLALQYSRIIKVIVSG